MDNLEKRINKQIQETINFLGMLGVELNELNEETFRKHLEYQLNAIFFKGILTGTKKMEKLIFKDLKKLKK
jgi:hypothetical protein